MARAGSVRRAVKYVIPLLFVMAALAVGYLSVQKVFYPNRVKVSLINRQTNKPITSQKVTLRKVCSPGVQCETITLLETKTNVFGSFTTSTKELSDSFEVIAEGYKTDGPWLKRPASLFFSRSYSDQEIYSINIGNNDLEIKLEPA